MELNLKKPIVFFDLETTGINIVTDRIVEISLLKIHPDQSRESLTMVINPEMPIPEKVSKIHGIWDKDVIDKPKFKEVAKKVAAFMEGCDVAGFNSNHFDVPLLAEEFLRAEVDFDFKRRAMVDVQVIFHKMEQRTLAAAYKFYCGQDLEDAHSASADANATYEVLKSQLDKYENLQNDIQELAKFSSHHKFVDFAGRIIYNADDEEVFNFGKHKGQKVEDVLAKQPSYYAWMMNGDFPLYTKKVMTEIKLRSLSK